MSYIPATKTIEAIDEQFNADGGNAFRYWLERVLPHIKDAYRQEEPGFRTHMGGSVIGRECGREIFYMFRWVKLVTFDPHVQRFFNRGHLEEGRFIAMLLSIGVGVNQQDAEGNQLRISDHGGHFGGSLDSELTNVPDYPTLPLLGEYKTHGDKSFKELTKVGKEGIENSKWEHYVQQQVYMHKRSLPASLYLAINKNDDKLHGEIVLYNRPVAEQFIDRAHTLIFHPTIPDRLSNSPAWWKCKFCDFHDVCHNGAAVEKNCRTCASGSPKEDGTWYCARHDIPLAKEQQEAGCLGWDKHPAL